MALCSEACVFLAKYLGKMSEDNERGEDPEIVT